MFIYDECSKFNKEDFDKAAERLKDVNWYPAKLSIIQTYVRNNNKVTKTTSGTIETSQEQETE